VGVASEEIRIGIVGHGFMARAHAQAWRLAPQAFDLALTPRVAVLAGRDQRRVAESASHLGIDRAVSDWRELIDDDQIDVVDVCTPVNSHAEIAAAALTAGKHVLCEKPLALSSTESLELARAAEAAHMYGVVAMVGYNYRRVPALQLAHSLCQSGRIGRVRQLRARYMQDWLADSQAPWSWRLDAEQAGAGALADLGSHLIDIARFVLDDRLETVTGTLQTVISARPAPQPNSGLRAVTVDDCCSFLGVSSGGTVCSFEASRRAHGRKNQLLLEIDGDEGALAFDLERLNELRLYTADGAQELRGFRTVLVTEPTHPYIEAWWPPGHVIGWDATFVHQVRDFIDAVHNRTPAKPDFADGAYVQAVIESVQQSAHDNSWRPVETAAMAPLAVETPGTLNLYADD
jgi:predicted dehydrogenase